MAVYVVKLMGESDDQLKVGYSKDVRKRMRMLLPSFPQGLRLLAVDEGAGRGAETTFHRLCAEYSLGEEWYRPNPWIDEFIRQFGLPEPEDFSPREKREPNPNIRNQEDAQIAKGLMVRATKLMEAHASAQEYMRRLHSKLYGMERTWTRRRVRAVWEGEARRIDHFEIRNLEALIEELEHNGDK